LANAGGEGQHFAYIYGIMLNHWSSWVNVEAKTLFHAVNFNLILMFMRFPSFSFFSTNLNKFF
jgi:hypothetical protein